MLLIFSLLFYAWGEPVYVLLMAFTTLVCYICARMIAKGKNMRLSTAVAVIWGIGTLVVFKYTAFLVQSFNSLTHLAVPVPNIALPVGISFFTFQAISYVLDVKRGDAEAAASYADVLLYISLFPQLIAGPIVRYSDVAAQIKQRTVTAEDIAAGLRRFCFGMGKKVLIANTLAYTADKFFALDGAAINAPIAWLGAVCYLMQIYFDFSGYSDSDGARWYGIESSVAAWHQYAFFTDNGGMLQCVDLNSMTLKYAVDTDGDGDAGIVIEESADNNTIFLYAANKADGRNAADGRDKAYIRKIDGRTGTVAWTKTFDASAENAGGAYAPVHIGKNELNGTIIASLSAAALNDGTDGGLIIALDKTTGEEKWRVEQADGIWSAPVVIYDENGKGYILQCDRGGKLTLYSGIDGQAMCSIDLGSRIESTPAVFNNTLVVGTRGVDGSGQGPKIVGIRIG